MASKSSNHGRRFRRPKFSTVIALVALFAVLGGSAYAAKQINGKDIKKNTVTSKAVKNGTLKTKDLSSAAQADLQGQQGPQGPKGNNGANGVIAPLFADQPTGVNLTGGNSFAVATLAVNPDTAYIVTAKTNLFGGVGVDQIDCNLNRNNDSKDSLNWNPPANNTRTPASLEAVIPAGGASITISCASSGGVGSASQNKIIATPVG